MKKVKLPLVSIVVPVHNEEETLEECLDSLINQTYKNTELIIVDDDSIDRSPNIIKQIQSNYENVKARRINAKSIPVARNAGVELSKGQIILQTDANVWYAPDFIEKCLPHFKNNNIAGVHGKAFMWNTNTWYSRHRALITYYNFNNQNFIKIAIKEGRIPPWIMDKVKFLEIGGYDVNLPRESDVDLGKRFLKKGYKIAYEPQAVFKHRFEERIIDALKTEFRKAIVVFPQRIREIGYFNTFLSTVKLSLRLLGPIILIVFLLFLNRLLIVLNIWIYLCLLLGVILCNIGFAKDLIKYTTEGIQLFRNTKGYPNRLYALFRFPYQYIRVVSFGIGMLYSFLKYQVLGVRYNE